MNACKRSFLALTMLMLLVPVALFATDPVVDENPAVFLRNLRDADGGNLSLGSDPATPLYVAASGGPLLAPDGHHVTLGEWIDFDGRATLKCVNKGTHVNIHVDGLVPNALYSIFIFAQNQPPAFSFGRMPSAASSEAGSFVTNEEGNGTVNAIIPAGPLSFMGELTDCLLDYSTFSFILVYQSDGLLYPGVPGPPQVSVNHATFNLFF